LQPFALIGTQEVARSFKKVGDPCTSASQQFSGCAVQATGGWTLLVWPTQTDRLKATVRLLALGIVR